MPGCKQWWSWSSNAAPSKIITNICRKKFKPSSWSYCNLSNPFIISRYISYKWSTIGVIDLLMNASARWQLRVLAVGSPIQSNPAAQKPTDFLRLPPASWPVETRIPRSPASHSCAKPPDVTVILQKQLYFTSSAFANSSSSLYTCHAKHMGP